MAGTLPAGRFLAALDVSVGFGGRRLGYIDRIRARKRLLQPLLQRLVRPALPGGFDVLTAETWSGPECPPDGLAVQRFCRTPKRAR